MGTYWEGSGKYQSALYAIENRMPDRGMCKKTKDEIVRAATRLYYDHHNNGACNTVLFAIGALRWFERYDDAMDNAGLQFRVMWTRALDDYEAFLRTVAEADDWAGDSELRAQDKNVEIILDGALFMATRNVPREVTQ